MLFFLLHIFFFLELKLCFLRFLRSCCGGGGNFLLGYSIFFFPPLFVVCRYDIRCVYIPSDNRSTWQELVQMVCHLLQKEVEEDKEGTETTQKQQQQRQHRRHLTVVGESFGACLAIRLALASPSLITHLVLVNVSHQCCARLGVVLMHFGCASIGLVLILMEDNGIMCMAEQWWVAD
jgi:hypothetical protein